MPPSWHLLPNGPKLIAAYVRTLGAVQQSPGPGDPEHGRIVYQKAGCASCHIVNGQGTGFGPELSGVGRRRPSALLRSTILHPDTSVPQGFLMVRVQAQGGPEVTGVRVNEDSLAFSLKTQTDGSTLSKSPSWPRWKNSPEKLRCLVMRTPWEPPNWTIWSPT